LHCRTNAVPDAISSGDNMDCDAKKSAFQDRLLVVQNELAAELQGISTDTERKAKEIADDFEADHDLAEGVGAAAGTAVGAFVGGPPGALVGEIVGKQIGSLFTLEIGLRREAVVLDVPQTTMKTEDFSFDLPAVAVKDTDISFDVPTFEMRRERGPDIPETRTRMEQRCIDLGWPLGRACSDVPVVYVEMVPSYYDKPTLVMKTTRIVVGLPTVEMRRQEFKLDVPQITVKKTEFSADVPYITLRFIKDAGKRTAALAAALAQEAQDAAVQKQIAFKERLKSEVAPLAVEMFRCFRETILAGKSEAATRFADQIATLSAALTALVAKGVPQDNEDYKKAQRLLDDAIASRDSALKPFDDALAKLDESAKRALEQFVGSAAGDQPKAKSKGGLAQNTPAATPDGGSHAKSIGGLVRYSRSGVGLARRN